MDVNDGYSVVKVMEDLMKVLSWKDVISTHKTISGINSKDGIVNSLLCSAKSKSKLTSPDMIQGDHIHYFVHSRNHAAGYKALMNSFEKRNTFTVFEKLDVNQWCLLGEYQVIKSKMKSDMQVEFILKRVT